MPLNPDAIRGVQNEALQKLLSDQWEDSLARYPVEASRLGDHRYDDRLARYNPEAIAEAYRVQHGFLERARQLDIDALSKSDALSLEMFIDLLESSEENELCHTEQWALSARGNPLVDLEYLPEVQPIKTPEDGHRLAARFLAGPQYIEDSIASLKAGIAAKRTPTKASTQRVIEQLQEWLEKPCEETAFYAPIREEHPDWSQEDLEKVRGELKNGAASICSGIQHYREFLVAEVLPVARPDNQEGVLYLSEGEACYKARIRDGSSLRMEPKEIHQLGLEELAKTHAEIRALGKKLFGTEDLQQIFQKLRTDPSLYFATSEEVAQAAETALNRAKAAMPSLFGRLPKAPCVVKPIPESEAPYTTIAYYRQPVPDGSQPGEYRINTYEPQTRPRFEAEVLAYHESIPGHHLQVAISQELPDVPAFRRNLIANAFVEGWALYTERLADEVGLYSGELDRLGMLSFDTWRSSRLVVDTGIHAMGWTREQAVAFMLQNTALTEANIRNEVDRYISWPGQALGYKLGQREFLRLRARAKELLGERFMLAEFHDQLLRDGAVPLPILSRQLEAWLAEVK